MFQWIKNLISLWGLHNDSRWFEKNQAAQMRLEDVEDWCEELEDRVIELESNSHPCKELHEFEAYPDLIKRIEQLENK